MTAPRCLLPAAALSLLAGCAPVGILAGVDAATVAVLGRDVVDVGVSAVTGRDCSVVRLDRREPYCAPRERLPLLPPLCTRTLGDVQCWANPEQFATQPRQIADTPPLTGEQVSQITARWPKSLNLFGE